MRVSCYCWWSILDSSAIPHIKSLEDMTLKIPVVTLPCVKFGFIFISNPLLWNRPKTFQRDVPFSSSFYLSLDFLLSSNKIKTNKQTKKLKSRRRGSFQGKLLNIFNDGRSRKEEAWVNLLESNVLATGDRSQMTGSKQGTSGDNQTGPRPLM